MNSNGNYPPGAEYDPSAPYNEKTKNVEVFISVIYSTEVKVTVPVNYTETDLYEAVKEQVFLPHMTSCGSNNNWNLDNISVIE